MAEEMRWGTWEVFVLCGAVLRHGTADWGAVAAELRPRTPYSPFLVTPEGCEAKFRELQEHFSSIDSLFDELRKCRIAELRRELEQSEDSIGSLRSKIEILKGEKESEISLPYNLNNSSSATRPGSTYGLETCSNDRSYAGSFTQDSLEDWPSKPQYPTSMPTRENRGSNEFLDGVQMDKAVKINSFLWHGWGRKRRRTWKRKAYDEVKEGSASEICTFTSIFAGMENPREEHDQRTGTFLEDSCSSGVLNGDDNSNLDLMRILDSILENKGVMIFERRLQSQKKMRYKKIIRQHVDFQCIRSRIADGSITSMQDLLFDLLLLSNNALVFFPRDTRGHNAALLLRELVMKLRKGHQIPNNSSHALPTIGSVNCDASESHFAMTVKGNAAALEVTDMKDSGSSKPRRRGGRRPAKGASVRTTKRGKRPGRK